MRGIPSASEVGQSLSLGSAFLFLGSTVENLPAAEPASSPALESRGWWPGGSWAWSILGYRGSLGMGLSQALCLRASSAGPRTALG